MKSCLWTCVIWSTCVETDTRSSWQLIGTGFGGHTFSFSWRVRVGARVTFLFVLWSLVTLLLP